MLCRAGISTALVSPWMNCSTSSMGMLTCPVYVTSQSTVACARNTACVMRTMRSRLPRSMSAPACMLNSTIGSAPTLATSPTTNAELESWSASHPTAMVCIQEPIRDSVCPTQNSRKFRWRPRTRKGLADWPVEADVMG